MTPEEFRSLYARRQIAEIRLQRLNDELDTVLTTTQQALGSQVEISKVELQGPNLLLHWEVYHHGATDYERDEVPLEMALRGDPVELYRYFQDKWGRERQEREEAHQREVDAADRKTYERLKGKFEGQA